MKKAMLFLRIVAAIFFALTAAMQAELGHAGWAMGFAGLAAVWIAMAVWL